MTIEINLSEKQKKIVHAEDGPIYVKASAGSGKTRVLTERVRYLINKSKKILDGQVKDVRKQFRSNLFEIEYKGTSVGFANALWTGFELVETRTQDDHAFAIVKNLNNSSANDLLRQLLNDVEVISFRERIPTMNDIFIESVQNNKPLEA